MAMRVALVATLVPVLAAMAACGPPPTSSHRYVLPVAPGPSVGYGGIGSHHDYPAADIFASSGCGTPLVSPVDGKVLEVRTVNLYDPAVDNPAYRGGKYVSIRGEDGVRYYLAHLDTVAAGLVPGSAVAAGQRVGTMGQTGRAGACHVHLGISPTCPGKEWAVRRGVIWPQPYLDAWRTGGTFSPAGEVAAWTQAHPGACAAAMGDPYAPDA
jgi:murein DD-endopeptidase MepM/ murein hydrolase activator NlpD